jgi:YbbR domain-containing protein
MHINYKEIAAAIVAAKEMNNHIWLYRIAAIILAICIWIIIWRDRKPPERRT